MLSKLLQRNYSMLLKAPKRRFSEAPKQDEEEVKFEEDDIWEEEDEEIYEEKKKPVWMSFLKWGLFGLSGYLLYENGKYAKEYDFQEDFAKEQTFYVKPFYKVSSWVTKKTIDGYDFVMNPPVTKFLPDEAPFIKELLRKTLVLSLEDVMYKKDMRSGEGLVLELRPGFRKFLKEMQKKYEIVVYTKEDGNFLGEVIRTIDPYSMYFPFFFGHEFCVTKHQVTYKDLKYLNRKPNKIIAVDIENHYLNSNNNVIGLRKYEEDDHELKKLTLLLNHLAKPEIKDVRREIRKLGGYEHALDNYYDELQEKIQNIQKKQNFFSFKK